MAIEQPTYLAVETHEGRATLGGKRRLLNDLDEAVDLAAEFYGRLYALEPIEPVDITPVSATVHVSLVAVPGLDPEPRLIGGMVCPCGTRGELYEGDDRDEWDAFVASHDHCRAEVA